MKIMLKLAIWRAINWNAYNFVANREENFFARHWFKLGDRFYNDGLPFFPVLGPVGPVRRRRNREWRFVLVFLHYDLDYGRIRRLFARYRTRSIRYCHVDHAGGHCPIHHDNSKSHPANFRSVEEENARSF